MLSVRFIFNGFDYLVGNFFGFIKGKAVDQNLVIFLQSKFVDSNIMQSAKFVTAIPEGNFRT